MNFRAKESLRSEDGHTIPDRARVLLEINNAIVSQLDLVSVLKAVSECLRREIRHEFASLAIYNAERNELRLHALDFDHPASFLQQGQLIPLVGTPASLAFSSRKPVLRHRPDFDEFPAPIMKQAYSIGIRSGCAVPLLFHDKIIGSMMIASLRESAFTEDDAELLRQIGVQVAIAVDNARNYEQLVRAESEVARERDRTKLMLEINNAVISHLDLGDLFKTISESLGRIIPHDGATISLLDSSGDRLLMRALIAPILDHLHLPEGTQVDMVGTPEGEAIRTGKPVLVKPDIDLNRFNSPMVQVAIDHGIRSGCAVPLIAHGRTLGCISLISQRVGAFGEEDATLLEHCSSQIALAVSNALNFENSRRAELEVRRERDRSQLLLQINNALALHLDLRELVEAISQSLANVLSHDWVGLSIRDPETENLFSVVATSTAGTVHESDLFASEGTISELAFNSGQLVYIPRPDPMRFPSKFTQQLFSRGLNTLLAVPMSVHGRKIGVMFLASKQEDAVPEDERKLFEQVAQQVSMAVANALATKQLGTLKDKLAQEKLYLENEIRTELNFDEVVGQSAALKKVLQLVETVAASDSTVLLLGETGTGKELIARAVHDHSRRKSRTFVKMNCAAIPTGLLESELFGHERGAFTGAIAQKVGRLELADQGTLFLDEVGDIPTEIQPKLLRALQEREFERLGSIHTKKVNVRLVAATNRDLAKMTETREFRSDLYYRLNVFPIRIPPLRERREDIPLLVRYFVERLSRQMQKKIETVPSEAMQALMSWHWPGNVRELENLIERAVILTSGTVLQVPLPEANVDLEAMAHQGQRVISSTGERERIVKILRETRGVLAGPEGAAIRLGMKRTTLQYKIKKLAIAQNEWWPAAAD